MFERTQGGVLVRAVIHDLDFVDAKLDNLGLRLTVRLGILLAAGIALLGAVIKLA